MDYLYLMLGIAAILVIYQLYFRKDDDELDSRGRPRRNR